eukprot:Gregarina_sp_Poly_1__2501@NODE_1679_length_3548_cov_135_071244_g1103_i0_p2_GENE_NODE_1679_length_3548_cov_135_071244_g1103_i0NODE_1679_length_3548_cov_135_071244_g1103_i0_p2_ORF_typecomplete_len210_score15_80DUF962/PF06127_11/2_1e21DUF4181/PF13789_6/1_8e03DUF4181/PF13789_6/0_32_NODE_1679_length_3548_cov_135_071244_g1103_i090719
MPNPLSGILARFKISRRFDTWDAEFIKFFSFYAAFHTHPLNKLIHVVGIPSIYVATLLIIDTVLMSILRPVSLESLHGLGFNSALLPLFHYMTLLQCGAEPLSAMMAAMTFVYYALISSTIFVWIGPFYAFWLAMCIQLVAWTSQIYGHWVYDKNSPALLREPLLTVQSAPYFIVMEVLFASGFRPDLAAATSEVAHELRSYYNMPMVV